MTVPGMSWWWWGRQPLAEGGQPSLQPPTAAEVGPRLTGLQHSQSSLQQRTDWQRVSAVRGSDSSCGGWWTEVLYWGEVPVNNP